MWKTFLSTLKPAGEVADKQYDLTVLSTLIMVVVVAVVSVIFFYVIVRFRRSRVGENTIPKQVEGNKFLEITWTVIDFAAHYSCDSCCIIYAGASGHITNG